MVHSLSTYRLIFLITLVIKIRRIFFVKFIDSTLHSQTNEKILYRDRQSVTEIYIQLINFEYLKIKKGIFRTFGRNTEEPLLRETLFFEYLNIEIFY